MICLDSDFIIDYLRGKKEAVDIIEKFGEEAVTTEINIFEVFYGIYLRKDFKEEENLSARD